MHPFIRWSACAAVFLAAVGSRAAAQSVDVSAALKWRSIGPVRGGRARAVVGVPSQPNVFYVGFDNGGVWRSTDYGANWEPIFDQESTGSIGAIAVAPSDPGVIYVGTGAGIIRPDLATGNGMYKSTDGGKTWTHLGLDDSQMIAMIDVDPRDPNRLFVAVLGHPYGPNSERGLFRSTDGGRSFQKVLYQDEYTSADDVRIDPTNPNIVYAALWQQQQSFIEGGGFGGGSGGIFKSTDGGTSWNQVKDGLPPVLQANLAIAPSNPKVLYATVAPAEGNTGIALYKSTDAGEHWRPALNDAPAGQTPVPDARPLGRIGGGDLPTITVDPKNENVVYSASTVFWRTEDGGVTWTAVRGAPGGDDYQRSWINTNNTDIIALVADQGAVISGNRGKSWSNWYNQSTAAMYHTTTDNAFPYRVCGGQQDSGSACVDSRSMDGRITFHDWHPVNIQEYGIAAPDPKDPDLVFGSMRSGVSLYNRKTGQTTMVGPDMSAKGANGERYNRNVRTMPIGWSPVDPGVLFYASNAVWKSTDHAMSWTRISPDLTRQTWAVPASAGKYAAGVTPGPQGAITAMSLSPRDLKVIWTGSDDGTIQVTTTGGAAWTNVTPGAIKPWTRNFNLDAGHFDARTAYAAANTLRIDDQTPHLWRTHDGGKTWTEITTGMAPGAVANTIREDPRKPGLLYAGTDTQVWVSFDDGDHWQSLRQNMPAISVRDLEVKDDSTCLCSDLVAGTHGRGFWILDDVTPLRQMAEARVAGGAYLFKPVTAVRVRFATNEPTPWPPELPAGDNPPPGAILDYTLPVPASAVRLEVLNGAGKVVRSYSSTDPTPNPDAGVDPEAYNRLCQRTPNAAHCAFPLYWAAPAMVVGTGAGMHRISWDLKFDPIGEETPGAFEAATGAVPHRTYAETNAPWAPPGAYTVRLTVDGKSQTQPLTVRLDPRVKTPAPGLARLAALSTDLYGQARATHEAYTAARALASKLEHVDGADVAAFKATVDSVAPVRARRPAFGRAAAPVGPPTLDGALNALISAIGAMQGADVAPTSTQVAASAGAREQAAGAMARWKAIKGAGLAAFNAKRKAAGQPEVSW